MRALNYALNVDQHAFVVKKQRVIVLPVEQKKIDIFQMVNAFARVAIIPMVQKTVNSVVINVRRVPRLIHV
jgi:hypothetical protein